LQLQGPAQCRDCFLAATCLAQRQPELTLRGSRARLARGEGLENAHCLGRVAGSAQRRCQQQQGGRVFRHYAQDFVRLLGRQTRLGGEQPLGVGQGRLQSAQGFRPSAHKNSAFFDTTAVE
jgi:hypothetical protein